MKILHLINSIEGGAGNACLQLHQALLNEKIDSKVLFLYGEEDAEKGIHQVKSANTLLRRVLRKLGLSKRKEDLIYKKIKKISSNYLTVSLPYSSYKLQEHPLVKNADMIHLHWVGDFVDLPSFFSNVKQPITWTLHDMNPIAGIFHYEQDQRNHTALATIDAEVRQQKRHLMELYQPTLIVSSLCSQHKVSQQLAYGKVNHIPCIINTEKWKSISKNTAKKELGLATNCITIGFGAQQLDHPYKGYPLFCEAVNELEEDYQKRIQVLTFGEHQSKEEWLSAVNVTHLGKLNQPSLNLAYAAMDVFVVSSLEESFGQQGLEALLCNTPIIAANTGAMPEYAQFPSLLFEVGSAKDLKAQLTQMIQIITSADAALNHVSNEALKWYHQAHPVEKHIKLYQQLTA